MTQSLAWKFLNNAEIGGCWHFSCHPDHTALTEDFLWCRIKQCLLCCSSISCSRSIIMPALQLREHLCGPLIPIAPECPMLWLDIWASSPTRSSGSACQVRFTHSICTARQCQGPAQVRYVQYICTVRHCKAKPRICAAC